jgi:hypothetical protein
MCHPFSRPALERLFSGIQFGMDDWGERELSQLAADGRRLTWRIIRRLVCADALRLGTSRAPAKTPAWRTMLGDDGNQIMALSALRILHSALERLFSGIQFGMDNWGKWGRIHAT